MIVGGGGGGGGWGKVLTAALGPDDGDDGVGEATPQEPRPRREPRHRLPVHLPVRPHHLRRVAADALPSAAAGDGDLHGHSRRGREGPRRPRGESSRRTPPPRGEERERERRDTWQREGERGGFVRGGRRSEAKGEEKDGVSRTRKRLGESRGGSNPKVDTHMARERVLVFFFFGSRWQNNGERKLVKVTREKYLQFFFPLFELCQARRSTFSQAD